MTDRELIRKVHEGSKEALNSIADRYYNDVYRFCLYLTGHETDSYDIAQEVFLKFIKYVASYQYQNLKGYLLIIARNLCRNYFSHRKSAFALEEMEDMACEERQMEKAEDHLFLCHLLQKIPEEQREVIILRTYEEMKFRDIARLLGCNLSTVKSRYQLGIANMNKILEREDGIHG